MKAIVILLVVLGLVMAGVYFYGGYASFDPTKQGEEAKAKIKPGMTWQQVIAIAGENPKLRTISVARRKIDGQMTEERMVGPKTDFNKAKVASRIASNAWPEGFILSYMFSQQSAYQVTFDSSGLVLSVEDEATMADLLQSRDNKRN